MKRIGIEEFLQLATNYNIFDVRSPGEYAKGHIPHAFNLPIVDDTQRAEVGTLYVQHSKKEAYLKGLEIIGPKLHGFASQALEKSIDNKILLYCWRGGMRSESMAWLFELLGLKAIVLEGGYKSFREYVRKTFEKSFKFLVIGGYTGSGKTAILESMKEQGHQVLDLEGLAHHKGSAFGSIGMGEQPHYESFEIGLFNTLTGFDREKAVYVEDESREIGRLQIPQALFKQIQAAPLLMIQKTMDDRVSRLEQDYIQVQDEELIKYVYLISKRLGSERTKEVISAISEGRKADAIREVLYYYDKAYQRTIDRNERRHRNIQSDDDGWLITEILKYSGEVYNEK